MKILFLDDSAERYNAFIKHLLGVEVLYARSAAEAISYLDKYDFTQVFLDHDLGETSNGMAVVDHICQMECPPANVIVHSTNEPAAKEMCKRLADLDIPVQQIPFSALLKRL